jgi:hypothetical protein
MQVDVYINHQSKINREATMPPYGKLTRFRKSNKAYSLFKIQSKFSAF